LGREGGYNGVPDTQHKMFVRRGEQYNVRKHKTKCLSGEKKYYNGEPGYTKNKMFVRRNKKYYNGEPDAQHKL
jgi:hypothetical protein